MSSENKRMMRERRTIKIMIEMYCRDHHGTVEGLCDECSELYDYAMLRLDKCRFSDSKPTCTKCPVHCYNKDMREKVRKVMRYSGPRMLRTHPVLAIYHLLDGRHKPVKKMIER